jgi:hypothetical protein
MCTTSASEPPLKVFINPNDWTYVEAALCPSPLCDCQSKVGLLFLQDVLNQAHLKCSVAVLNEVMSKDATIQTCYLTFTTLAGRLDSHPHFIIGLIFSFFFLESSFCYFAQFFTASLLSAERGKGNIKQSLTIRNEPLTR